MDVIKVLGCHSPFWLLQQTPETGWLIKFCFVLNKIVFLAVLKIKVLADSVSDQRWHLLVVTSREEEARELCGASCIRTLIPSRRL